ncbi:hypothetical protein E2C01_080433 [Portunus trituberculatus]|uniref:Uncharacterized protein n=1 Tax=Portunus trituberculatus TaxID=210409 RepID=A0A5B7IJQ3_PORTR|nr:hypothetical protein [Portunus trituberculatus]
MTMTTKMTRNVMKRRTRVRLSARQLRAVWRQRPSAGRTEVRGW